MAAPLRMCQVCAVGFTYRKFLEPLCVAMAEAGYGLHVAYNGADVADASPEARALGLHFHPVPIARSSSPLALLRATHSLWRLFRQERFTVVHVHTPVAAIAARLAAAAARTPVVIYTAHGFYFHEGMAAPVRLLHIASEWLLARLTTLLLTQSAEDAQLARRLQFKRGDRIHAIGNGVAPRCFRPATAERRLTARSHFGLDPEAVVIGVVARLVAEKGYLELFDAFGAIAAEQPHLQLLICGSRLASDHAGSIDAQLNALIDRFPEQVVHAGHVDRVDLAYDAMDLFCLPSWREGMPRTIIEAMMSGVPVVATDIRGSREEVEAGVTGLLVPVRNPAALAKALQSLTGDVNLRRRFGAAGRLRALRLYDEEQVIALQLQLLQQTLLQRGLC